MTASGLSADNGVPAGHVSVLGISYAPTTTTLNGCPVKFHGADGTCRPPDDRVAWNYLFSNWLRALDAAGMGYDCTSPQQLYEMICRTARACAILCRSTVEPAPTVWPPVDYSGPFVADDSAATPVLYWWDCDGDVYVALPTGGDLCAAVDVAPEDTTQPVYGLQCIAGTPTRVELPRTMTCASGSVPAVGNVICAQTVIAASILGGRGNGTWSAEFATNYTVNGAALAPFVMMRVNGGAWVPLVEIDTTTGFGIATVGPRHARPVTGLAINTPGTCTRRAELNPAALNAATIAGCSSNAARTFGPTDLVEFALSDTGMPGTQVHWQATFIPA